MIGSRINCSIASFGVDSNMRNGRLATEARRPWSSMRARRTETIDKQHTKRKYTNVIWPLVSLNHTRTHQHTISQTNQRTYEIKQHTHSAKNTSRTKKQKTSLPTCSTTCFSINTTFLHAPSTSRSGHHIFQRFANDRQADRFVCVCRVGAHTSIPVPVRAMAAIARLRSRPRSTKRLLCVDTRTSVRRRRRHRRCGRH